MNEMVTKNFEKVEKLCSIFITLWECSSFLSGTHAVLMVPR
jgi:hypothetical protein